MGDRHRALSVAHSRCSGKRRSPLGRVGGLPVSAAGSIHILCDTKVRPRLQGGRQMTCRKPGKRRAPAVQSGSAPPRSGPPSPSRMALGHQGCPAGRVAWLLSPRPALLCLCRRAGKGTRSQGQSPGTVRPRPCPICLEGQAVVASEVEAGRALWGPCGQVLTMSCCCSPSPPGPPESQCPRGSSGSSQKPSPCFFICGAG